MTPQEAITMLKRIAFTVKNEPEEIEAAKCITALKLAIEALEKQIPKKPITTKDGNKSCSCGLVVQTGYIRNCLYYCDNCGQAIDWSEEE